jgi:hypothetical protein
MRQTGLPQGKGDPSSLVYPHRMPSSPDGDPGESSSDAQRLHLPMVRFAGALRSHESTKRDEFVICSKPRHYVPWAAAPRTAR